jgi:hypothetical protein
MERNFEQHIFYSIYPESRTFYFHTSSLVKNPAKVNFCGEHPLFEWYEWWCLYILTQHLGQSPSSTDTRTSFVNVHILKAIIEALPKDDWCLSFHERVRVSISDYQQSISSYYRGLQHRELDDEIREEVNEMIDCMHFCFESLLHNYTTDEIVSKFYNIIKHTN